MLNIRTLILSILLVVILMLTVGLVTARTEVVSDPSSDPVTVLNHQDRYDTMNKVPIPSYRSPFDVCYDVPLREVASCRNESHVTAPSYRSPLDECFDVPLREIAGCRDASRSSIP